MKFKLSVRNKLILTCIGLVIIPVAIVGGSCFWEFSSFNKEAITQTYSGMEQLVQGSLTNGVLADREKITGLLSRAQGDITKLSTSGNLANYLSSASGGNESVNRPLQVETSRVVEGITKICMTQQEILLKKLDSDLAVAEFILSLHGKPALKASSSEWEATNQLTQEKQKVSLPVLGAGNIAFDSAQASKEFVPVVDESLRLVGDTCTIFQRMNEKGDMLRVATNVRKTDKSRAIGTFIPAVNPDGQSNPVAAKVLQGETYRGRAFVVDAWYITVYKPLFDESGQVMGMLYSGVKERASEKLNSAILSTNIGKFGHPFVFDSKGSLVIHPQQEWVGKNIVTDLNMKAISTSPPVKETWRNRTPVIFVREWKYDRGVYILSGMGLDYLQRGKHG